MQFDKEEIENLIAGKIKAAEKSFGLEFKNCLIEIISLEKMIIPQTIGSEPQTRLIPVPKWNEYHPYPSTAALRMLIFRADENGFNSVIERKGKRVLINEQAFFQWWEVNKNKPEIA